MDLDLTTRGDKVLIDNSTLMRSYKSVPQWWYLALLGGNFAAAGELIATMSH